MKDFEATLDFEHAGEFELDQDLLLADPETMGSAFADMVARGVRMAHQIACRPGQWHVLVVDDPGRCQGAAFVLLCHERELQNPDPLTDAELIGHLQIHSGRFVALAEDLRDESDIRDAILEAESSSLPGIIVGRGAAVELGGRGAHAVYTSIEDPRTVIFLAAEPDEPDEPDPVTH